MDQIVIIQSTYSPYGGVEQVALNLIKGLLLQRVRVTLLTLPNQHWPVEDERLLTVPLGFPHAHRLLTAWTFNRGVSKYLNDNRIDCIFSFDRVTRFTHLHAGGGTHKAFLRIKNTYSSNFSSAFRKFSLFHHYTLHVEKKGFENSLLRKVQCISQLVKENIQADYNVPADKLMVVPIGIRWKTMGKVLATGNEVAEQLRLKHHIDPEWRCLLFLGSGFARKGLDIAIRGLKALAPVYHLLVVGKDDVRPYRRLATALGLENRVHFFGAQPDGWRYCTLCRALVLPSRYEPFGGAAAEGHAMGIPVLVSEKTGYRDFVIPAQNGIVLKSLADQSAIEDAFAKLAELIEAPLWTPDQLREHVSELDDAVILDQLLNKFLV